MIKEFNVISHTHWDREWYLNFELFNIKLVELIDNLIDILEKEKEYIFHLDAQTIVLEDYLNIKPEKKSILNQYIKEKRILIGPWYVQNDFYLTSGESTIRNLLIGSKIAEAAGECTWIGYVPDQFGLISQLPQIFQGFDINECVFGRGYDFYDVIDGKLENVKRKTELLWQGADGTRIFSIHMPFWYNNAQRFSSNLEKSMGLIETVEKSFETLANTPHLLLMNGVDHLEAQEDLLQIIDKLNESLPLDKIIKQTSMTSYVADVKDYILENKIPLETYVGEMRNGIDLMILQGTLSSRIYLKTLNFEAQNILERIIEPIYSMIWMTGAQAEYPYEFIMYLWKSLMKNHPHDSICGCSIDDVHKNMEDRFQRFFTTGNKFIEKGMDFLTSHIDRSSFNDEDYIISIFNTLEFERTQICCLDVEFPQEENVQNFIITDEKDEIIPYVIISKKKRNKDMFTAINLPGMKIVDCYSIQVLAKKVPALGFKAYRVCKSDANVKQQDDNICLFTLPYIMENEYIKIDIDDSGKITLQSKTDNMRYENVLVFEDSEDCGDSYIFNAGKHSNIFTSENLTPLIIEKTENELYSSCTLRYDLYLPSKYDGLSGKRSEELILNRVDVKMSFDRYQKWLDVECNNTNSSKDHRLRLLINTGIDSNYTLSSSPFDVIKRDRRDVLNNIKNGTQPNNGVIALEDSQRGIAVFNKGLYEYEHLLNRESSLAITLVRATGIIALSAAGDQWKVPGNQCLRNIKTEFAIFPYDNDFYSAEVLRISKEYQVKMLTYYQSVNIKKFIGGRAAVQESFIDETFYRMDAYPQIKLSQVEKFIDLKGDGISMSALKRAENGEGLIIRVYNSLTTKSSFTIKYVNKIKTLSKLNLKEIVIENINFEGKESQKILINPKEIVTIFLD